MRPVAMVELRAGDWATLGADATALRMAVFVQEQGIDPAIELDDTTPRPCMPWPITAWPSPWPPAACCTRHRATREAAWPSIAWCAASAGRAVLDALVRAAQARGDAQVTLHAQCSAGAFTAAPALCPWARCSRKHRPHHHAGARFLNYSIDSCLRLSGKRQSLWFEACWMG
jgi:hypothetical protein